MIAPVSPLAPVAPLLTTVDVASALRVSERTLRLWIKDGKFPAPMKVGRGARWQRADVETWIEQASAGGAA